VTIKRSTSPTGTYTVLGSAPNAWERRELKVSSAQAAFSVVNKLKVTASGAAPNTIYTYTLNLAGDAPANDAGHYYQVEIITKYDDGAEEDAVVLNAIAPSDPPSYPPDDSTPAVATSLLGDAGITGQVNNIFQFTGPAPNTIYL
jgi:hypothetical protein